MRRALPTIALIALLLTSATPFASAQEGDMAYFDGFDGLQRIIGRTWMAPMTTILTSEVQMLNEQGTPMAGWRTEPLATPEPVTDATLGQLTVFIYLFDNDDHASAGLDRIDDETQETIRRDPRAPMTADLPLDGIGDRQIGYTGELEQENVTITYSFATVQDGPFVYQLFTMSANVDPVEVMRNTAETLVRQPMNRMAEQFDPNGGSRGGLWSKFDSLDPDVPADSTVSDLIVYPMPEPEASPMPHGPRLDLADPDSIAGLVNLDQMRYTGEDNATPTADRPGVFRIDTWLLTFESEEAARDAAIALDNTLIEPFGIFRGRGGAMGFGDDLPPYSSVYEGYIQDRSLPPGNGVVVVRQDGSTLAGVAVYAIDVDPLPAAEDVADALLASGFPQEGDPILQDLVPITGPGATPES
ncbi:MAG TPA: hypothetical protein VNZ58_03770 [Thermomicrobiales bacterium]|nr:hypothetical protein [Thermomicrobiales bacterium]